MDRILSFGGGLQTTALAILIAERKVEVDAVVFADTGAEKPETYWYIDEYVRPLLQQAGVEFITVRKPDELLYEYCWRKRDIPSIRWRWCTDRWKVRPVHAVSRKAVQLIGFSTDENHRALREFKRIKVERQFPLLDLGLSATDCRTIIADFGWPRPLKSACFICSFARMADWYWLKANHRDLFQKALDLEENWYQKKPGSRAKAGLLQGRSLKRLAQGEQIYLPLEAEYSCYSGYCGR